MCGLIGFIDYKKITTLENFDVAVDAMYLRGPDARGAEIFNFDKYNIGLGHRRLSIVDLDERSNQPMHFEKISLIYNGEVYNFKDIQSELIDLGYHFKTTSDTEVILKAYIQWGVSCVNKFIGMFSIVIFDKNLKKLFLIRDRLGVKPLYLYQDEDFFIFASETKAIIKLTQQKLKINKSALNGFFSLGYVPGNESIFENVHKVNPGTIVEIDITTKEIKNKSFWSIENFVEDSNRDDITSKLKELLKDSVKLRLIADVDVGSYLSGGLDSSYITKLMEENHSGVLKSFTIGFNEKFNEAPHAKKVAEYIGTSHFTHYLNPEDVEDIIKNYSSFFDEPFSDDAGIPMLYLSKKSKETVKVVISSDGGDELFAGYNRYPRTVAINNKLQKIPKTFRKLIKKLSFVVYRLIPKNNKASVFFWRMNKIIDADNRLQLANLLFYGASIPEPELQKILSKDVLETRFDNKYYEYNQRVNSTLKQILITDIKERLVNQMLVKVDKSTMGASVEGREPLLDHRLFELLYSSDVSNFIKKGNKKHLFKSIIRNKFNNSEILNKPKMGFETPVLKWLKDYYADYVESEIKSISKLKIPYIEESKLLSYWNDYKKGNIHYQNLLWRSLIYINWYKTYMINEKF